MIFEYKDEIVFVEEAFNFDTGKVRETFKCPSCNAELTKDTLERSFETTIDPVTKESLVY